MLAVSNAALSRRETELKGFVCLCEDDTVYVCVCVRVCVGGGGNQENIQFLLQVALVVIYWPH